MKLCKNYNYKIKINFFTIKKSFIYLNYEIKLFDNYSLNEK